MGVGDGLMDRYGSPEGAAAYRRKYEGSWIRRASGRREIARLEWALAEAGTDGPSLDVPCGAGRLARTILARAPHVTGVDLSAPMVAEAREALTAEVAAGRVDLHTGSADALAFPDAAFDTVVCWRLLHHLVDRQDRVKVLTELRRVSRRAVVISFADAGTWKARLQRLKGRNRRCVKLTREELAAEAREAGLVLGPSWRLSSVFSLLAAAVLRPA